MMNLHRLRLLRELKLRGTIAAVAEALSYTPSAVSQQLSLLENETRVKLLEPHGRRVQLTAQGQILADHVGVIMQQLEVAEADLARSLTSIVGTVRIASFQTAVISLIPWVLDDLSERHPSLKVLVNEIQPDGALSALAARDHDLVIGEEYPGVPLPRHSDIDRQDLTRDPLQLVSAERWANADSRFVDLHDAPWVMEPHGNAARQWAMCVCREAGFEPDVRYESSDLLVQQRLVETGHAVALLPGLLWANQPTDLQIVVPPGAPHRIIFTAVRRGAELRPDVRAVRQALARAYALVTGAQPGKPGDNLRTPNRRSPEPESRYSVTTGSPSWDDNRPFQMF